MCLHKSEDKINVEHWKVLGKFFPIQKDGLQDIVADFLRLIASSEDRLGGNVTIEFWSWYSPL
jgi:hypothetical protein